MARHIITIALAGACLGVIACSFDGSGLGPLDGGIGNQTDGDPSAADADTATPDAAPPDADPNQDRDDDGVADFLDNCPDTANSDQHDEDLDGHGDACDNCPAHHNPGQENQLEQEQGETADEVGDACDPRPEAPGDSIAFFDGFGGSTLDDSWSVGDGSADAWTVGGDQLTQDVLLGGAHVLYWSGAQLDRTVVEAVATPIELNDGGSQGLGVAAGFVTGTAIGTGYLCYQFRNAPSQGNPNPGTDLFVLRLDNDGGFETLDSTNIEPMALATSYAYRFRHESDESPRQDCTVQKTETPSPVPTRSEANDNTWTGGYAGLRTFGVRASFDYFLVYELGPETGEDDSDPGP